MTNSFTFCAPVEPLWHGGYHISLKLKIYKGGRVIFGTIYSENQNYKYQTIIYQPAKPDILPCQCSLEIHILFFLIVHQKQYCQPQKHHKKVLFGQSHGLYAQQSVRIEK